MHETTHASPTASMLETAALGAGLLVTLAAIRPNTALSAEPPPPPERIHVIYGTDLFHPHDDPDDHYDLATLFAIPDFQIDAILLDLGDRQKARPGRIPLEQMFRITGRKAPYAAGLSKPLASPQDKALDRPPDDQKAIELLLQTLHNAREPVTIITVGSVRDLCAAFNREPDLLRDKVHRLYINIGSADKTVEWNVGLDLHAYIGIMRSGLPVYWCPCLPTAPNPHSTYWKFQQGQMLEGLPAPVLNYFIYALQRVRPDELDPMRALDADLRPWRQLPGTMSRNMWGTASFLDAAGYVAEKTDQGFVPRKPPAKAGADTAAVFRFIPAAVEIDDKGQTRKITEDPKSPLFVFTTPDNKQYEQAMTDCLRWLLMHLGQPQSR